MTKANLTVNALRGKVCVRETGRGRKEWNICDGQTSKMNDIYLKNKQTEHMHNSIQVFDLYQLKRALQTATRPNNIR